MSPPRQGQLKLPIVPDAGHQNTAGISAAGSGMLPPIPVPDAGPPDAGPEPLPPLLIDQCGASNPALLTQAQVDLLKAGGPTTDQRVLYPYDGTVLPRGLRAPLVMFEGAASAVLVRLANATGFEYLGCLQPTAAGEVTLPANVWTMAEGRTGGSSDPFTLELTLLDGTAAHGPLAQKLIIAQASLKGSIFYDSYTSSLPGADGKGTVLRIAPGEDAEVFLGQSGCTACHSMSADGSRLIAETHDALDTAFGAIWQITPSTLVDSTPSRMDVVAASFAGMSPDGKLYMTSARVSDPLLGIVGPITVIAQVPDAHLYETDTGLLIASTGLPAGAITPSFSPSGKLITFNDYAIASGHGLAVMSFDATTRRATDYRELLRTNTERFPGWPVVLPDDAAVVFSLGVDPTLAGSGYNILDETPVDLCDLMFADLDGNKEKILAQAMGFASAADAASDTTYLPFGEADVHQNFYPTLSPVAAGGYFWIFFDSVRHYGVRGRQRQLWGAAITISADGTYEVDPSHPAFYLPGQEPDTTNHRAFTALDPCKADGQACETGIDCCQGFCTGGVCAVPPVDDPRCARTEEACKQEADCCNPGDQCIAGFCSYVPE